MLRNLLLFSVIITTTPLLGNDLFEIGGKIFDSDTKEVVPFVSIRVLNANSGTITNEDGEFLISVKELPVMLVFSHITAKLKLSP